jgi:hypothetical protein
LDSLFKNAAEMAPATEEPAMTAISIDKATTYHLEFQQW